MSGVNKIDDPQLNPLYQQSIAADEAMDKWEKENAEEKTDLQLARIAAKEILAASSDLDLDFESTGVQGISNELSGAEKK